MYKSLIKPAFFTLDAEKAHNLACGGMKTMHQLPGFSSIAKGMFQNTSKHLEKEAFGLQFKNPVGLAAGFDKDAKLIDELSNFGFGFIEIGTITPKAQDGNPKPRLFRLPADNALINRMGFNNGGVHAAAKRLEQRKSDIIVGGNIGKNKVTPNDEAVNDYKICFETLFDLVDYFVVNVSSPNTPNLRALQDKEPLTRLLSTLQDINQGKSKPKPLLLKIAPDLTTEQLDDIISLSQDVKLDGLIATNTTISRDGLATPPSVVENIGAGGLSGAPVNEASTKVLQYLHQGLGDKIKLIGVGGIYNGETAKRKIEAGASLVQVYSGFIFEGPSLVKNILASL